MEWFRRVQYGRVRALAPDLVYAEAASAFAKYVRVGEMSTDDAHQALGLILDLPLQITPLHRLAPQALALALTRRISAYDACYLALADGRGATLVTADRRLAAEANESALLPPA